MKRRAFIALVGGIFAMPGAASAQERAQDNVKSIAIMGPSEEPRFSQVVGGLRRGLRDQGYADGALDIIERKVRRGDSAGATASVAQMMQQGVAVLFVIGSELARLARQVSTDVPIVFITPGDPVAAGLVASLARPGGNTTAMTFEFPELSAKRLELLKALVPRARQVLVLHDSSDASPRQGLAAARQAAPQLAITLIERETRDATDVARLLGAPGEIDAVLAIPGGATSALDLDVIKVANARRIPTFFHARSAGTSDALASYGANDLDVAREAARIIDKVLKGEKAGNLPVERPTKLQFVINLKTARIIGLDVPPMLLARADEVIE
jgi:putative tryptophan/tyrosine transport system substrate-binding protein